MIALQRVFASAPEYCSRAIGHIPDLSEMRATSLPGGKTPQDQYFFAIYLDHEMIGCADILRGYPTEDIAYLGLLLLSEKYQRMGLGAQAFAELERIALSWPGISTIRGAIMRSNDIVVPFWEKMGLVDTGIRRPWKTDEVVSESMIFEKKLLR